MKNPGVDCGTAKKESVGVARKILLGFGIRFCCCSTKTGRERERDARFSSCLSLFMMTICRGTSLYATHSLGKEPFLSIFGMTRQVTPLTSSLFRERTEMELEAILTVTSSEYKRGKKSFCTLEIESNIKRFIYSISV